MLPCQPRLIARPGVSSRTPSPLPSAGYTSPLRNVIPEKIDIYHVRGRLRCTVPSKVFLQCILSPAPVEWAQIPLSVRFGPGRRPFFDIILVRVLVVLETFLQRSRWQVHQAGIQVTTAMRLCACCSGGWRWGRWCVAWGHP